MIAALDTAYADSCGHRCTPALLVMFTIRQARRAIMPGSTARVHRNALPRLTSIVCHHTPAATCPLSPTGPPMPALLTSRVAGPIRRHSERIARSASAALLTSASTYAARPPSWVISRTDSASSSPDLAIRPTVGSRSGQGLAQAQADAAAPAGDDGDGASQLAPLSHRAVPGTATRLRSASTRRRTLPDARLGDLADEFQPPHLLVRRDPAGHEASSLPAASAPQTTKALGMSPASSSGLQLRRRRPPPGGQEDGLEPGRGDLVPLYLMISLSRSTSRNPPSRSTDHDVAGVEHPSGPHCRSRLGVAQVTRMSPGRGRAVPRPRRVAHPRRCCSRSRDTRRREGRADTPGRPRRRRHA